MKAVFFYITLMSLVCAQNGVFIEAECNPNIEICDGELELSIEIQTFAIDKAAYYVEGIVSWVRAFLPLLLASQMYYNATSYIAPAADFLTYLPLAINWTRTGQGKVYHNTKWVKWNKWIQLAWILTALHIFWYSYKYGYLADNIWLAIVGPTTEAILWILYYVFAKKAYLYIAYLSIADPND